MLQPEGQSFAHRQHEDDGYDSICRKCFATVGSAQREEELHRHESAHVCDPVRLYQVGQGWIRPLGPWG
jgi:hypothetical protein